MSQAAYRELREIQKLRTGVSTRLAQVASAIPDSVIVDNLLVARDTVRITGTAARADVVLAALAPLAARANVVTYERPVEWVIGGDGRASERFSIVIRPKADPRSSASTQRPMARVP